MEEKINPQEQINMLRSPPKRISFKEREEIIDLPNLIEIQIKSFKQFLQGHILPHERENLGLQEVFNDIFPIKSYDEKTVLEFLSYNLGTPKYTPEECIRRGITYNVTLKVKFRLTDETGIKEEEVYMGTVPIMTDKGTFVINGAERVIVSQLHRSPGIAFEAERHVKGNILYSFRIIPYRGSWLEASFDTNDLVYIFIDRKKISNQRMVSVNLHDFLWNRCIFIHDLHDLLHRGCHGTIRTDQAGRTFGQTFGFFHITHTIAQNIFHPP